ncbi:uncharacterized protein LOC133420275 [Cololabis saira]|uniref:uncharacterized protein LOC133420275 n=1 Tax=Cololabis saira TaxID=129043 RepID=UPI002AD4E7EE|nr:uncharacterized protein LOC133420275 [Cololabis saira]
MTSAHFVFCLTYLFLGKMAQKIHLTSSSMVHQETGFISAHIGDHVTLKCNYNNNPTWLYWYMQPLGEKPKRISTFYIKGMTVTFNEISKNNSRFTLDIKKSNHHLTISDLNLSDSATYYCAARSVIILDFAEGKTVTVKDSDLNIQALIHQSSSETIQPGDSVSLNCTVHAGSCGGEHSVYWFKESEKPHPALIYTHGARNDQCERKSASEIHTCMYHLPMKNLNVSHAGTYYCAVASCGHILFGNQTKLDFTSGDSVLVYFLTGTLTFTSILAVVLIFQMYKMSKIIQSAEERFPAPPAASTGCPNQDTASPQYAALELNQANRSRRQRSTTNSDCVYSSVRL